MDSAPDALADTRRAQKAPEDREGICKAASCGPLLSNSQSKGLIRRDSMKREIHVCDGVGCGKPLLSHSDGLVFKGTLQGPTGEKVFEAPADQEVALCWGCLEKTKPAQVNPFTQPLIPTIPFPADYPGITYPYPGLVIGPRTYPTDRITIGDPPPGWETITISSTGTIGISGDLQGAILSSDSILLSSGSF